MSRQIDKAFGNFLASKALSQEQFLDPKFANMPVLTNRQTRRASAKVAKRLARATEATS